MKKKNFLKTALAMAIIAALPSLANAQWQLTGNAPAATNYLGTSTVTPIRFATGTGGTTIGTNLRMILSATGNLGIGQRAGTINPTAPLNKLLVENGNIYDWTLSDGIYDRLIALFPPPTVPITASDFSLIAYSNTGVSNGHNFAVTGYASDPAAEANTGLVGVAMDGLTNTGTVTAGMNGPENRGLRAAAVLLPGITTANTDNIAIVANVDAAYDADNRGLDIDVNGDDALFNKGINVEVDGNNADNNDGIVMKVHGNSVVYNNTATDVVVQGSASNNRGHVLSITASATSNNIGHDIDITGSATGNNYGTDINITASGTNNTGSEISVGGASTFDKGQMITVNSNATSAMGIDVKLSGNVGDPTGTNVEVTGYSGSNSVLGSNVVADASTSPWAMGVGAVAKGASSGNTGGNFTAYGGGSGSSAHALGVAGEILNASSYINYAVYGDYNPNNGGIGTHFAGFFDGDVFSMTNFFTPSDPKLKENVVEYKGALDQLSKLDVKNYSYKTKEYPFMNLAGNTQIGIMANNLKEVFPNLVKHTIYAGKRKGEKDVEFDAVNNLGLVPVLVQAVKELDAKSIDVSEVKEQIAALQANKLAMAKELEAVKADNEALKKDLADVKDMLDKICSNGCGDFKPASTLGGTIGSESGLFQNIPNPFSNNTVIPYTIGQGVKQAILIVTNVNGAELRRFTTSQIGSGTFEINLDEFGAGTYVYSLFTDGKLIDTKKMTLSGF